LPVFEQMFNHLMSTYQSTQAEKFDISSKKHTVCRVTLWNSLTCPWQSWHYCVC